jgi:hypothetical protein
MNMSLVLISLVVATTGGSPDERALTTWLAETAAQSPGAEVVTSADVTQLMELHGQKQVAGCDAADSGMDA